MKPMKIMAILVLISVFWIEIFSAPPGFNPNLSIEEQRRQEEFLRKQRESVVKEKASQHFDEDSTVEVTAMMRDAITGKSIDGTVSYVILNSGKKYMFTKKDAETYLVRIRKLSDIRIIFEGAHYFTISEIVSLSKFKPLERMELSTKLLRKPESEGSANIEILFDADSAVLKASYYDILRLVGRTLKSNHSLSVVIKGYAGRDAATDEAAQRISGARAQTIMDFLIKDGVSKSQIQTIAMGIDESPKDAAREYRAELMLIDLND